MVISTRFSVPNMHITNLSATAMIYKNDQPILAIDLPTANQYMFPWGFIENENNWAVLVNAETYSRTPIREFLGTGFTSYYFVLYYGILPVNPTSIYREGFSQENTTVAYLLTGDGATKILDVHESFVELPSTTWIEILPDSTPALHSFAQHDVPRGDSQYSFSCDLNIARIPLQDGFYYQIKKFLPLSGEFENAVPPMLVGAVSLCTPNDEEIFNGEILIGSYITITKVKRGGYLIGLDADKRYFQGSEENHYYSGCVKPGLYLCEKGVLTKLEDGHCINQRLRPMTKYKNWQKRIQELTIPE